MGKEISMNENYDDWFYSHYEDEIKLERLEEDEQQRYKNSNYIYAYVWIMYICIWNK